MAASARALADCPQLVDKADTQRKIWKYFIYIANSQCKPTDPTKPVCSFKPTQNKRANTSNLAGILPTDMSTCSRDSKGFTSANMTD